MYVVNVQVVFAAAMATMAFLSYHIVRLWVQDCKTTATAGSPLAVTCASGFGAAAAAGAADVSSPRLAVDEDWRGRRRRMHSNNNNTANMRGEHKVAFDV